MSRIIRCKVCLEAGKKHALNKIEGGGMKCPNCRRIVQIKGSKPIRLGCADPVRFRTRGVGGARSGEQSSSWYKPIEFTPPRENVRVEKEKVLFIRPEPEIFDQDENFVVITEFPGRSKEEIEWRVENGILLIQSKIGDICYKIPLPAEMKFLKAEIRNGVFQIDFKKGAN